jgi:coatomer subunit alpha
LEAAGVSEDQVTVPDIGEPLSLPQPVVQTFASNWPVKSTSTSVFEKVLLGEAGAEDELAPAANGYGEEDLLEPEAAEKGTGLGEVEEEGDAEGWDMGEDVEAEVADDFVNVEAAEAGAGGSEADLWARNSPIAADHAAGGSIESAMQLLSRQIGAVNFKPLQWRFEEIYIASRTFLPASAGLPPLINYVRRTVNETDSRHVLPLIPRDLESVSTTEYQAGKTQMRTNKLEEGVVTFRKILHLLMLNAVSTPAEFTEVSTLPCPAF